MPTLVHNLLEYASEKNAITISVGMLDFAGGVERKACVVGKEKSKMDAVERLVA